MDDVELSELIGRFQALQQESISSQITERNVVEIVSALVKKKLIEVLYTTDAKEYLTWDALRREIIDEVYANGGRLNVVDLPGLLCVHATHVEHVISDVLLDDPTLTLENGELLTQQYLDTAVQSAGDMLTELGFFGLAQFSTRFQFSSAFATKLLSDAVNDGRLSAVMQDASFYTKQFVRAQCTMLRTGLLGAQKPVDLQAFFERHKLFAPLMDTLIERVRGELPGSFDAHAYTPSVFEAFRDEQVHNVYSSNGFIDYVVLQRLAIRGGRQYLLARYNSPDTQGSPEPQAASKRGGGGKRRPKVSAAAATASLLVRSSDDYPLCGYPLSSCFVSDKLLANTVVLQSLVDGETLAVDLTQHLPAVVDISKDWAAIAPRLAELYPGLVDCELIEDAVLMRNDAKEKIQPLLVDALKAEAGPTASSAKKGKGAPSKARGPADTATAVYAKALRLPEDQYESVLTEIADRWSDMLSTAVQSVEAARNSSAAAMLKSSRAQLLSSMGVSWVNLCVVAKGLQWAKAHLDESTYTLLSRHVIATGGYELCRCVVLNESLDRANLHEQVSAALEQVTGIGNLKKAVAPFHSDTKAALAPLTSAMEGKDLDRLLDVLQELCGSGAIAVSSFHPPNKKVEREAYAAMRESAEVAVKSAVFSMDASANGALFIALLTLLVHLLYRVQLDVPGKAVSAVVLKITQDTSVTCPPSLMGAQAIITSSLQTNAVDAEQVETLETLRGEVLAML